MEQLNENEMRLGDKLIIAGNLLGALSMMIISIGGILRTTHLPESPIFMSQGTATVKTSTNYWDR
jgi:hypothetical protein